MGIDKNGFLQLYMENQSKKERSFLLFVDKTLKKNQDLVTVLLLYAPKPIYICGNHSLYLYHFFLVL